MSMLVSFVLSFFPRDVLDGILNLIGSVSEGFPSYSFYPYVQSMKRSVSLIVLRYLRLSCALYGPFIWKKMIFFHEIFQAGACPNLKDSSLYEMYSVHMYKARNNLNHHQFSSICDSQKPYTVHFIFGKR